MKKFFIVLTLLVAAFGLAADKMVVNPAALPAPGTDLRLATATQHNAKVIVNPGPIAPPLPLGPAGALCDNGNNAAASLLIPFFMVDMSADNTMDTYIGITNLGAYSTVAHVVVWNVDSIAIFDFNIYLTGYDVATWSMRDILVYGAMPNNGCPPLPTMPS